MSSYLGTNGIGKLYLGSTEIAKAYLGSTLIYESGGGPTPPAPVNYLVYGNPTINGNSYIPDTSAKGFIYTKEAFDPGTAGWIIQTRMKRTSAIAYRDIIASVNESGASQYSIGVQTNARSSNTQYGMYLSGNGTSWNLANNTPTGTWSSQDWMTFQLVCTRSGNNYVFKMGFPDLSAWTSNASKTSHPLYGKHIAFGGGFAGTCIAAEFDLSATKIWIDNQLWWEAITQE